MFFTLRETREKVNITWHENGTVSYYQVKRWYFEPELTKGSLDDLVTTVNVPFAVRLFFSFLNLLLKLVSCISTIKINVNELKNVILYCLIYFLCSLPLQY